MNAWRENQVNGGNAAFDDPRLERRNPISDEEAATIESICLAATPGPLVTDDEASGEGAPVFSMPDGRMVVSLSTPVEQAADAERTEANTELLTKARYWLLCLLRDRAAWQTEREQLLERVAELETEQAKRRPR